MMKTYEPITSERELDAAIAKGARIEFTACGCDYNSDSNNGWIRTSIKGAHHRNGLARGDFNHGGLRMRAVYAAKPRPALFQRIAALFTRRAAA